MSSLRTRIRTSIALGLGNLLRVVWYRAGLRFGFKRPSVKKIRLPVGCMFHPAGARDIKVPCAELPSAPVGEAAPNWHRSVYTGAIMGRDLREWWRIPDFDSGVGDIKGVWATSRFDWVISLAQHACCGNSAAMDTLETWLDDWSKSNPPYMGANWKCGQEASIRVLHLATGALILGQTEGTTRALLDMVEVHLERIEPTLGYAIAQNNNHGTSEAAALFIGGSWLERNGRKKGRRWVLMGRKLLANRATKLICADGTFSQYSVNYHRMVLDTYSLVEAWRRSFGLSEFSSAMMERLAKATDWLRSMVQPETGDAPNIGANDGALLIPLAGVDFRDFRPSVQLATRLFLNARAFIRHGSWDRPLRWLGLPIEAEPAATLRAAQIYDEGGFAVLRKNRALMILRYPRFRFRPSQSDALHVDLWVAGENRLRDGGTYSYFNDERWLQYFPGTASHNTIQFDGRDQMPRLGRFLFGDWLETTEVEPPLVDGKLITFGAGYRDWRGVSHFRRVALRDESLRVEDKFSGFTECAILRWRLAPGHTWRLDGHAAVGGGHRLSITGEAPLHRIELVEGWESRYYMQRTPLQVLEVEIGGPGRIVSEYWWTE